jgi:hypothetical protein
MPRRIRRTLGLRRFVLLRRGREHRRIEGESLSEAIASGHRVGKSVGKSYTKRGGFRRFWADDGRVREHAKRPLFAAFWPVFTMERTGIEPVTPSLQSWCSPS